jgi:hypothetical protein
MPDLPHVPAPLAAAPIGLLVALVGVGLVWLGEHGCEALRGRPSCGGLGLIMLVAIVAGVMVLGMVLLRWFRVDNPGLVSFLGVALPLIVVMLFLIDEVFSAWMVVVLPALTAVCFAVSAVLVASLEATETPGRYADADHRSRTSA